VCQANSGIHVESFRQNGSTGLKLLMLEDSGEKHVYLLLLSLELCARSVFLLADVLVLSHANG
jgi:hypothetical protein